MPKDAERERQIRERERECTKHTHTHINPCLGLVQFDHRNGVYTLKRNGQMTTDSDV